MTRNRQCKIYRVAGWFPPWVSVIDIQSSSPMTKNGDYHARNSRTRTQQFNREGSC